MYFTDGPLRVLEREMRQKPGFQNLEPDDLEDYNTLLGRMLSGFHNPQFAQRAWEVYRITFSGRVFPNLWHRARFEQQLSPCGSHTPRALAVLYLITADEMLWKKISRDVYGVSVQFGDTFHCHPSAYLLYRIAKGLNAGIPPERLIGYLPAWADSRSLMLILTAFLIRRYGSVMLRYDERNPF